MHQFVKIERLVGNEYACLERIALREPRIFGFYYGEVSFAFMFHYHRAVGQPRQSYTFATSQLVGLQLVGQHEAALHVA